MTTEVSLKTIPVATLVPHPQNPRAVIRQHVVDGIVDGIKRAGGFKPNHAITVRKVNGHYEIISGHHRTEAAKAAGLTEIPCWVEDMDDETAFYELIRNNHQGELSPLEIGLHALDYVKLDKRGLGAEGKGLKGYADGVGYAASKVTEYRQGATVFRFFNSLMGIWEINNNSLSESLLPKTRHLGEIHKAPQNCWFILVTLMLEKGWTVSETAKSVKRVQEFEVSEPWQSLFLPLPVIAWRALITNEFSPKTVAKLIETSESIESRIATYKTNTDAIIAEFRQWLADHAMFESWDVRKIVEYGREIQARAEAAEREEQERFVLGDWREHIDKLTDGSVSLILTDPPYGMGYQSDHRLDRDKPRKHATIDNDATTEDAAAEITDCLTALHSKLKEAAHVFCFCHWSNEADIRRAVEAAGYQIRGSLIWVKNNTGMGDPNTTFAPKHERIIHAVKGSPVLFTRTADVLLADRCNSDRHPTEKPVELLKQLIEVTTTKDEIVVDPFAGVASTLVAAKQTGRAFFGCEINEGYFNAGSDRL